MIPAIAVLGVLAGAFLLADAAIRRHAIRNEKREAAKRRHPSARRHYPRPNYRVIGG